MSSRATFMSMQIPSPPNTAALSRQQPLPHFSQHIFQIHIEIDSKRESKWRFHAKLPTRQDKLSSALVRTSLD